MPARESKSRKSALAPEIVAVIAAAIEAVMDAPYRITSIAERGPNGAVANPWASEGRRAIFSSHKLR
jgi:hypothetical protein